MGNKKSRLIEEQEPYPQRLENVLLNLDTIVTPPNAGPDQYYRIEIYLKSLCELKKENETEHEQMIQRTPQYQELFNIFQKNWTDPGGKITRRLKNGSYLRNQDNINNDRTERRLPIGELLDNLVTKQNYSAEDVAPLKEITTHYFKNSAPHDNRPVRPLAYHLLNIPSDEESEQASGSSSPTSRP